MKRLDKPFCSALFDNSDLFGKSYLLDPILGDMAKLIDPTPFPTDIILREAIVLIGAKFYRMIQQKCPLLKLKCILTHKLKLALHEIFSNQVDLGGIEGTSSLNAKKPP